MTDLSPISINIVRMMYELFSHNYVVISYFLGFLISLFFAIKFPTRTNFLICLGFALLVFNFEYEKHIAEGLRDQTEASLTGGEGHIRLKSFVQIFIEFFVPIGVYLTGWVLIIFGLYQDYWKGKAKQLGLQKR